MSGSAALFITVFLACLVEAVEALTIILAAGTARDWRSAVTGGAVAGLLVLGAVIAVLGPAISVIPLNGLRLFVGGLLLIFGLQWLRKAILRASGLKALHDETLAYQATLAEVQNAPATGRAAVPDWYAFTLSFKGVFLEGLEVAFIALTFGANQGDITLAAVAALAAVLLVTVAGFAIRAPLARVRERHEIRGWGDAHRLRHLLGASRGPGARWPGRGHRAPRADPSRGVVRARAGRAVQATISYCRQCHCGGGRLSVAKLRAFLAFWYDFIVGDDWRVAVTVAATLAVTVVVDRLTEPRHGG